VTKIKKEKPADPMSTPKHGQVRHLACIRCGGCLRGAVARLDTTDHFGAGAAVRHYFESWLSK
jgi:hypothetical protein